MGESQCAADCGPLYLYTPPFTSGSFSDSNGIMFDVTSIVEVYLSGLFTAHKAESATITLYTRAGSYQGKENSADGWTEIGSNLFSVQNDYDYVGFNAFDRIKLDAGSTQGFYFASTGTLRGLVNSRNSTDGKIQIVSPGKIFSQTPFVPYTNVDISL